jgi:hypothetical protein
MVMFWNPDKLERLENERREFLLRALSAGFFASGLTGALTRAAYGAGKIRRELPPGKSIYEIKGSATVDGSQANLDTQVRPNSLLETGRSSRMIFAVGQDAFILRSNSRLQLSGNELVNTLRLAAGAVLSVFGKTEHRIVTTTASVGIRGTGIYVEADPERSYVCTCYGVTDLQSANDATSSEEITSLHHDAPRYITASGPIGQRIQPAPFINHTDTELMLIEELVGRVPPFAFSGGGYTSPRRDY